MEAILVQAILAQAIFARTSHCFSVLRKVFLLCAFSQLLLHPISRSMVRKGWTQTDIPSGWVQILRGPGLLLSNGRSDLRFRARSFFAGSRQDRRHLLAKTVPRVNPDSREAARLEVTKLEKALEVMGDADGLVVECLKGELEKARNVVKR